MNYFEKSTQITEGLRKSFQITGCKMANRTCYGYTAAADGDLATNEVEAEIVKWIFDDTLLEKALVKLLLD